VIKFLRDTGLSDTQIKAAVSFQPNLLRSNLDKTLKPNVHELVQNGFSGELLVQLIRYNPRVLLMKSILPRLLFWRDFVGDGDRGLLSIVPHIRVLMSRDFDKHTAPNISLLKEFGLSNQDIVCLIRCRNRCMDRDLESLRQTIELIEELGLVRDSKMFIHGLRAVGSYSKDIIHKKVEFYKMTYGWSNEEVYSSFRKFPYILSFSDEKIKSNMNFLIQKAKLEPRSIAYHPILVGYSIEKRLVPRHHVLTILAEKGLKGTYSLASACNLSEKVFLEKCVDPYRKDVPELADAYFAAGGRKVSV
jgi:mTERF domain-containing protein, mitochondrial